MLLQSDAKALRIWTAEHCSRATSVPAVTTPCSNAACCCPMAASPCISTIPVYLCAAAAVAVYFLCQGPDVFGCNSSVSSGVMCLNFTRLRHLSFSCTPVRLLQQAGQHSRSCYRCEQDNMPHEAANDCYNCCCYTAKAALKASSASMLGALRLMLGLVSLLLADTGA